MTTVAVGQFCPSMDKTANMRSITTLVGAASTRSAELVVLPEYSLYCPPAVDDRLVESAEALDGQFLEFLSSLARERKISIVCGFNEIAEPGRRIHNTLVAVGSDGTLIATYRKLHLFDAFGYTESDKVKPGDIDKPQIFEIDGLRFGMQTCYDVRFPEVSRRIVHEGADVLLLPAAWVPGPLKEDHWTTLIRARAIENTTYVVAADQSSPGGAGFSAIVDPAGAIIAGMGDADGVATAEIDSARIASVRAKNPALALRRFAVTDR